MLVKWTSNSIENEKLCWSHTLEGQGAVGEQRFTGKCDHRDNSLWLERQNIIRTRFQGLGAGTQCKLHGLCVAKMRWFQRAKGDVGGVSE